MPYGNLQRAWTYDEYVEEYEKLRQELSDYKKVCEVLKLWDQDLRRKRDDLLAAGQGLINFAEKDMSQKTKILEEWLNKLREKTEKIRTNISGIERKKQAKKRLKICKKLRLNRKV